MMSSLEKKRVRAERNGMDLLEGFV